MTLIKQRAPGHRALRKGRTSLSGQVYLLTFTTLGRSRLFEDYDHASTVARALYHPKLWRDTRLLAWVLMPDHWHGLLVLGEGERLDAVVRRVKSNTARVLPPDVARPVWARGFHDHALRRDERVEPVARYIVMNPVRAGLVASPRFHPFWDAVWLP